MEDMLQDALEAQSSLLPHRYGRTNSHYMIQNDSACDLVLPPLGEVYDRGSATVGQSMQRYGCHGD